MLVPGLELLLRQYRMHQRIEVIAKFETTKEVDQKGKERSSVIVMCPTWENGDGKGWFELS